MTPYDENHLSPTLLRLWRPSRHPNGATRRTLKGVAVSIALLWACLVSAVAQAQKVALFDGQTLDGWVTTSGEPVTRGWEAADGALTLNTAGGRAGHILTDRQYGDFILEFEWRIAPGGNSGIKYKVQDFNGRLLGCEYQIIDDVKNTQGKVTNKSTASLYAIHAPSTHDGLNPAGEFNRGKIVVQGRRIEHWLNGVLVLTTVVGSADWNAKKAASKFSDVDGFGENHLGRIMLTDHNSGVVYRNIYLTPIMAESVSDHAGDVSTSGCLSVRRGSATRRWRTRLANRRGCRDARVSAPGSTCQSACR